jgi:phosphoketolase
MRAARRFLEGIYGMSSKREFLGSVEIDKTSGMLTRSPCRNPSTTRLWSPDELTSNKLDAVLEFKGRNFQWDPDSRAQGGRVIEILSEHTCQGMLQGTIHLCSR